MTDHYHRQTHIWLVEEEIPDGCVLTKKGVSIIAHHKYKPGHYTFFDKLLNPFWQILTDQLPIKLAPNAVTSMGGTCCLLSYLLTAHYNFDLKADHAIPDWLLIVNGLCLFTYYTFDCMDGKQARRTKSSTPLGQLFDHGMDCICNLSHVSLIQNIVRLNGVSVLWLQATLQLGFFQAQWEEYYTGRLPHAAGNIGTTEALYGISLWAVGSGLGVFDRAIYGSEIPQSVSGYLLQIPGVRSVLGADIEATQEGLHYRDAFILVWVYGYGGLAVSSFLRVLSQISSPKVLMSAMTKLLSPLSLCVAAIYVGHELNLANDSRYGGIRFPSLCIGLVFCIITIKLIVLGMAQVAYASLQLDVFPIWLILGLYQLESPFMSSPETKIAVLQQVFALASVAYLWRLIWWTNSAMDQICQRLKIKPFAVVPEVASKGKGL